MKLGEALIKAGKLTAAQLDETLKEQAIFGGKFGTNLIEMGYLEERELAEFLSGHTGIPFVAPEQLMEVPAEVVSLLPEEVVRRFRVMPVALEHKRLTLAMADPCDFAAIDAISFMTGCVVTPVITPELRLVCALEKHYHIPRETRYFRVNQQGRRRLPSADPQSASGLAPTAEIDDLDQDLPEFAEPVSFSDPDAPPVGMPDLAVAEYEHEEKAWLSEPVLRRLAEAPNRQAIAQLILQCASQQSSRVALFLLKRGKAIGWQAQSDGVGVAGFHFLEMPLAEAPLFARAAEHKSCLLGFGGSPEIARLRDALGGGGPEEILVVPLAMRGNVVALLVLGGPPGKLGPKALDLHRLMEKAALAFEILILKSKILMS